MEHALVALKIVTAVAGFISYVVFALLSAPEIQEEFIYKSRNPLLGDLVKYVLYAMNFCLVICALCPWWKVSAAPMWAWASVAFSAVAYLLYLRESRSFCVRCAVIGISVRACVAVLVTYLTHSVLNGANA